MIISPAKSIKDLSIPSAIKIKNKNTQTTKKNLTINFFYYICTIASFYKQICKQLKHIYLSYY